MLATASLRAAGSPVIVSAGPVAFSLAESLFAKDALDEDLRMAVGSFPSSCAWGKVPSGHPFYAKLVELGASAADLDWLAANAEPPDIAGYNHYPDLVDWPPAADFTRDGALPLEQAAREATDKVAQAIRRVQAWLGLPVSLSETSAGISIAARAAYAAALGDMAARLRAGGVPFVGLCWWPLSLAAQWDYREQPNRPLTDFLKPGGWNNPLYDIDVRPDGDLVRVETDAALAYRRVVGSGPG